jgi:2-oxoacid:acceptor oxidoreductase delta subunit (pyruvate/2-ketoisovalerate family)
MGDRAAPNVAAAREGYDRATRQHARAVDAPPEPPPAPKPWLAPLWPVSTTDSLALATGSWSLERPVLTEHCTACALCALFCPEGVITRNGDGMAIDLLHCKGCGICEDVCPVKDAVFMEEVPA